MCMHNLCCQTESVGCSSGGIICSLLCLNHSMKLLKAYEHLHLLSAFTVILLLLLRFYKALCHSTHYGTDLCLSSGLLCCWRFSHASECVEVLWGGLSLVSMYVTFYFVIKMWGFIFCPFFFNLKVKMYIALCCTGQCPKVNTFLIKCTWVKHWSRVFLAEFYLVDI